MKPKAKKIVQKFFLIPQRYVLAIMAFLAIANAFHLRVSLNMAITEMVIPISNDINSTHYDPDACPDNNDDSSGSGNSTSPTKPDRNELFDWDEEIQGLILSSLNWGSVFTHLPGGILADKFGGKYTLGIGVLCASAFTTLIPVAAKAGYGWLLAVRVLTGLADGVTFPSITTLLSRWIPLEERSLVGGFVYSGYSLGQITGTLLSGYLLDTYKGDWPLVFYVFGGFGIVWFFIWVILCFSEPDTHPYIKDKEKLYLSKVIGGRRQDIPSPPWRQILSSLPVWALVCAETLRLWEYFVMSTDMPKYMKDVLKYSIKENGVLSSIPHVVTLIAVLTSGSLADQIIKRKWLSVTATRKLFTTISLVVPSATLISASYSGCNRTTAVALFTLTMGLSSMNMAGMVVNGLDLSPNYAGTVKAITGGVGGIMGVITPYIVGVLTPNHTLLEWRTVFWITVGINFIAVTIFLWGGSGEVQPWNNIKRNDCCKWLPKRYLLAVMGFLGVIVALMLRICLSVAITEMVIEPPPKNDTDGTRPDDDRCPPMEDEKTQKEKEKGRYNEKFDWDQKTQGLILSSFYIGYVVTHVPGGIISDRFGGKHTLGIGILLTAILTFLIPVGARAGYEWLVVIRVLTGLGEGTTFPAVSNLLAKWIPLNERSFFGALVFTGSLIGTITGTFFSGIILHVYKGNWPLVFYIFGGVGLFWWLMWQILCYSQPDTHPFITDQEKAFLKEVIGEREKVPPPPWKAIFSSCPVWALVAAEIGHDWAFFTMGTDLPKYMKDVLRFPIKENALYSSLPWLVMWFVALLSGLLGDWLIRTQKLSVTAVRKIFTSFAHFGPAIGLVAASYAGCDRTLVVALFTISMGFMGTFYPGMRVNAIDLSPNYSGTLMAIVNGVGAITGFVSPYLIGWLTPNQSLYEWRIVFWITGVINILTVVVFAACGSAKIQPWNDIRRPAD